MGVTFDQALTQLNRPPSLDHKGAQWPRMPFVLSVHDDDSTVLFVKGSVRYVPNIQQTFVRRVREQGDATPRPAPEPANPGSVTLPGPDAVIIPMDGLTSEKTDILSSIMQQPSTPIPQPFSVQNVKQQWGDVIEVNAYHLIDAFGRRLNVVRVEVVRGWGVSGHPETRSSFEVGGNESMLRGRGTSLINPNNSASYTLTFS